MATINGVESGTSNKDATATQEAAVGITAFVSPSVPGFNCTIKQRYTDFLVNEILPNGQVLHLTDIGGGYGRPKHLAAVNDGQADAGALSRDVPAGDIIEAAKQSLPTKKHGREDDEVNTTEGGPSSKKPRLESELDEDSTTRNDIATGLENESVPLEERKQEVIAQVSEADQDSLQSIFGEPTTGRILSLYANIILHPDRKPRDHPVVKSDTITEKAKRTEAHVTIRRIFSSKLETATLQDLNVISIKAAPTKGPSGARGRPPIEDDGRAIQKGKLAWEELGGEYLHFNLYKENKDTMEALHFIATRLKVPVKNFQFAGTKDRRAVTVQRVAIFRIHAKGIAELNKMARGWRAGNFEYKKHGLELGELGGNEFVLTLRDCSFKGDASLVHEQKLVLAKQVLEKTTESFAAHGFLNYYGLQRFGSFSTGTHVTGRKILSGDLEGAVMSILTYSEDLLAGSQNDAAAVKLPQDDIDRAEAVQLFNSGKTSDAIKKMPKRFQAEAAIIQYLGKKERKTGTLLQAGDWQGALTQIPRNLRMMYVHAYQSFVWNSVAGRRWELCGNRVVEGDLVIVGEKDDEPSATRDEVDEDGEPIFHPAADDSAAATEDTYTRARQLSQAEAESGKYDIFDIVLPLPGYDVVYPSNKIGDFYAEFMASDSEGQVNPHQMRRSWKDISLSGAYRKLMARSSSGVQFEVKTYSDDSEQMVETDLERIQKQGSSNGDGDVPHNRDAQQPSGAQVKKIAIVLKLGLGSSQYATMALRELTKGGAMHYRPDYSSR